MKQFILDVLDLLIKFFLSINIFKNLIYRNIKLSYDDIKDLRLYENKFKEKKINFIYKNKYNYFSYVNDTTYFYFIIEKNFPADFYPVAEYLDVNKFKFDTVLDVGSCVGLSSLFFSKISKKVYSFEMSVENIDMFNKNIEINKKLEGEVDPDKIKIYNVAVSDSHNKEIEFNFSSSIGHHSLEKIQDSISKRKIKTTTIDQFCLENNIENIDCLKLDVEFHELSVLKGVSKMLEKKKINTIIFEYHNQDESVNLIFEYLEKHGFIIKDLNGNKIKSTEDVNYFHCDLIAFLNK